MLSLFRYDMRDYLRSHRYFPPAAIYLVSVVLAYSAPKPIPIMSSYAFTSTFLFVISGWIAVSFINKDDTVQMHILVMQSRSPKRVYMSKVAGASTISAILGLAALIYPLLLGVFTEPVTLTKLSLAGLSHLVLAVEGVALGALFCEKIMPNAARAWGGLALLWVVSLSVPGMKELLPKSVHPIFWIFPPVAKIMGNQVVWDGKPDHFTADTVGTLTWAVIYSIGALCAYVRLMMGEEGAAARRSRK